MILVTGATGTVGSEVVRLLIAAGQPVRVLVRDPAKVASLGDAVQVATGDLERPETLDAAFQGVDKLFLLASGTDLPRLEGNAIDAAKRAGVKHIVKLSASGAESETTLLFSRWHGEIEAYLKASGIPWTVVRPGAFMSNSLLWSGSIKGQGVVYNPAGTGQTTPIDPLDIAAVAVKALTTPGHQGKAYNLTGPESLSTPDQVRKISAALGRPLQCIDVPTAAARAGMLGQGMPELIADAVVGLMEFIKTQGYGTVSDTVEQVLGRPPRTFDQWLADHLGAFR